MYKVVEHFFDEAQMGLLIEEARSRYAESELLRLEEHELIAQGHFYSPCHYRSSEPGPLLEELRHGEPVAQILKECFEVEVTPLTGSYNHYAVGDYIGIHRDAPDCNFTALIALSPHIGPLSLFPDLARLDNSELYTRLKSTRALGEVVQLDLPFGSITVIEGSVVPHSRPPVQVECTLATMCFTAKRAPPIHAGADA